MVLSQRRPQQQHNLHKATNHFTSCIFTLGSIVLPFLPLLSCSLAA